MKLSFNALTKFDIKTLDRDNAAKLENLLYDRRSKEVRYIVARCGSWLFGDRVVVPATLIKNVDPEHKTLEIDITSDTLESCPSRNSVDTVSDDLVLKLSAYYTNIYPAGNFYGDFAGWTSPAIPLPREESKEGIAKDISTNLMSMKNLESYDVVDKVQNEVGRIHDAIVDIDTAKLAKVVVETGSWLDTSKYLLDIEKVHETDPIDRNLALTIKKHTLKRYDTYSEDGPAGQLYR